MAKSKQQLNGGIVRKWKKEAREHLGEKATPATLAKHAMDLASKAGYPDWQWDGHDKPAGAKKDKGGNGGGYTVAEALAIAKDVGEMAEEAGGKAKLIALLQSVDKAGGSGTVREILEAM